MTDQEVIAKYRQSGDKHWVGMLYERYAHLVLGVCLKYFNDKAKAEDVACEVFVSLFDKLAKHEVEHFKAWLYMNAKNQCLMTIRAEKLKSTVSLNGHEVEVGIDGVAIKELLEKKLDLLEEKIEVLKPEQAECIRLFYIEKKSYQEVSDQTQWDLKSVKSHLQNGKRNLKILLEQHVEFNGKQ